MNRTSKLVVSCLVLFFAGLYIDQRPLVVMAAESEVDSVKIEGRYTGAWITTKNKKLDGTVTCDVRQISPGHWQGKFTGVWQRVPFDYTVEFGKAKPKDPVSSSSELTATSTSAGIATGSNPVAGEAVIEGAHYDWTGNLTPDQFEIRFTGTRYEGHLELARTQNKKPEG